MAKQTKKDNKKNKKSAKKGAPARKAPAAKKTPVKSAAPAPAPSPRHEFLRVFNMEHATTLKVIKAFPADKAAFQPHPRSSSAKKLLWTFVAEQALGVAALNGTLKMPPAFAPEPATLAEVITAYDSGVKALVQTMTKVPEARLQALVPFFVGPGKMGDVPIMDVLWMMLMDSIHHRGQLSVYIRMAGGLVPSIYGPSADEPWM